MKTDLKSHCSRYMNGNDLLIVCIDFFLSPSSEIYFSFYQNRIRFKNVFKLKNVGRKRVKKKDHAILFSSSLSNQFFLLLFSFCFPFLFSHLSQFRIQFHGPFAKEKKAIYKTSRVKTFEFFFL